MYSNNRLPHVVYYAFYVIDIDIEHFTVVQGYALLVNMVCLCLLVKLS